MPTIIHKNFTDPEIHEPKDISTASDGEVYVADGAGSGSWQPHIPHGWGFYHDSAGPHALSTTASKITIDGSGGDTDEGHLPTEIRGSESLWDTATNSITPINEGDSYSCQLDFDVSTVSTASYLILQLDQGGAATPTDVLFRTTIPINGSGLVLVPFMFPATTNLDNNGGQLFIAADAGTPEITDVRLLINRMYDGTL